jgi:hypothetical protein
VCACVCVFVCVYVYEHIRMCVYVCVRVCVCVGVYVLIETDRKNEGLKLWMHHYYVHGQASKRQYLKHAP